MGKDNPTWDKQFEEFAVNNTNPEDPVFSRAYGDWMFAILKTRDKAVMLELRNEIAEVLKPWYSKLEEILTNQKAMQSDIATLKELGINNRSRIEALEEESQILKTMLQGYNKMLKGHNVILGKLQRQLRTITKEHKANHPK